MKLYEGNSAMRYAVLGTGIVGRTLAGKLVSLGHDVLIGTRDPGATLAVRGPNEYGIPAYADWQAGHPEVRLAAFADAAEGADVLVNATGGRVSLQALASVDRAHVDGKVLIDVANPLDFSRGSRPASTRSTATASGSSSSAPIRRCAWSRPSTPCSAR